MKNLVLKGIYDFPFGVLDRCRNLKRVELLGNIEYDLEETPDFSSAGDHRHLTMHNPCFGTRDISSWLRRSKEVPGTPWFMHLQSLDTRGVKNEGFEALYDILKACSKTLRELELDASPCMFVPQIRLRKFNT